MTERNTKRNKQDVIYIESDSDTTDGETEQAERESKRAVKISARVQPGPQKVQSLQDEVDKPSSASQNRSPIRTNRIPALPDSENVDALSLMDILCETLVETWQINFSIDLQYLLANIHPLARKKCILHIITAGESIPLREEAYSGQVQLHKIQIEDQWGTHHSKMMVNFHKDGSCQVVVHTANLLRVDWEEKTEAIWLSPLLVSTSDTSTPDPFDQSTTHGDAFKVDLTHYLQSYKRPSIQKLIDKLQNYDFRTVKAIFVPSIPGSYSAQGSTCGIAKLEHSLRKASFTTLTTDSTIAQVSSLGSLGKPFYAKVQDVLNTAPTGSQLITKRVTSHFKLIFPTVEDVRDSISGWISGFSLFFNAASSGGVRQIALSAPHLCKWMAQRAGRARVMPHIKTYARVSANGEEIRWLLVTSANMSKAALGSLENGRIKVKSYEAGVLLIPELFGHDIVSMKPSFKQDAEHQESNMVNIRMPYDLETVAYGNQDQIWSLSRPPIQLGMDWRGVTMSELMRDLGQ